jgi:hypothetical protein
MRKIGTHVGRLVTVIAVCAGLLVESPSITATIGGNPISVENRNAGTTAWELGRTAADAGGEIKGYASATSLNKGQSITFFVTVSPSQSYTIDVYRMGWYAGRGGRLMQHIGPLRGVPQPNCPIDGTTGMIACNWRAGYTLRTKSSWTSGIYLAKLTNARKFENYIMFVLRDDSRRAALLYQQPVNTYQAYNAYPEGGKTDRMHSHSLYPMGGLKGSTKVSFDRPYDGSGASSIFLNFEINFVRWLERSGYDVTYSTDIDTHSHGSRLRKYQGFLSVGHDEYWSKQMYDSAIAARDSGVNLAFFGANAIYWQVRLESSSRGVPNRVLAEYRDAALDPVSEATVKTVEWRDPPVNRPEQTLIGVQYTSLLPSKDPYVSYVVTDSTNWVYAGSGLRDGDKVLGIVGYEADRAFDTYPKPSAVAGTYALLSHSPFTNAYGATDYANSSVYQAPSGAWVFAAGTFAWSWALDNYGHHAPVVPGLQRTTANILNRFSTR